MSFTRKKRSGASYTDSWYVCGFAKDKGPHVCQHRVWYRRDWLEAAIVDRFRYAMTPQVIEVIVQTVKVNVGGWAERRDQRANELKAELVGLEREAANLVQYLKDGGTSATVRAELEATEEAIRGLRLELANAQRTQTPAPDVEPAWIKAHIERLYELLRKDPARAKREMTKHLDGDPAISPLPGNPGEQRAEITGRVKPDSLLALNQEAAEFRLLSDHWLRGLDLNQRPLGYEGKVADVTRRNPPKTNNTAGGASPHVLCGVGGCSRRGFGE